MSEEQNRKPEKVAFLGGLIGTDTLKNISGAVGFIEEATKKEDKKPCTTEHDTKKLAEENPNLKNQATGLAAGAANLVTPVPGLSDAVNMSNGYNSGGYVAKALKNNKNQCTPDDKSGALDHDMESGQLTPTRIPNELAKGPKKEKQVGIG